MGSRTPLLSRRRGDCTIKKSREASLVRADGVVWSRNFSTTPPRPLHLKVASLLLLDVASTPPPAEEGSRLLQLSNRSDNLDSNAWPGGVAAAVIRSRASH